jgi:EAL domain-containing protein (putative c-di-GMP-specific phosphodiesterase class I)
MGFAGANESAVGGADLVRNASLALKRAKDIGPGNVVDYTQKLADATRRHVSMLHDLRTAFMAGRLAVVYQPQIDLASGRTTGVEALLRWYLDDGAAVPLEQIIPVAEQSGLIIHIGAWVLRTALAVQRRLSAGGRRLRMAVNVSAVQFRHPDFVAMVGRALGEAAIEPGLLEVEITESAALHGWTQTIERLEALRALGVCVAIDDFGTGFSSLAYLDRLPADCLKIDRSFIRTLDDPAEPAPIAETVITLGRQLGMRVLAEGVETTTQRDRLTRLGCHEGQGWLYARPMPEGDLATWLHAQDA